MADQEASIEDRLVAALTDEPVDQIDTSQEPVDDEPAEPIEELEPVAEGEDDPEPQELEEDEYVTIELEGKVYEVPKELEGGFLQQKDYTQKTQTLADQRREVELVQQQIKVQKDEYDFAQSIQDELTQIAQLDHLISNASQIDWHSMTAEQMMKTKLDLDMVKEQKGALVDALSAKQKEFQDAQEQAQQELLEKGAEILKKSIPGWNEESQKEMREYALTDGFTEQEVAGITDPRHVRVLWKAAQYDKIKAGAEDAKNVIKQAPTIKARSRKQKMSKEKGRELNLRKKLKNPNMSSRQKADAMIESGVLADRFG